MKSPLALASTIFAFVLAACFEEGIAFVAMFFIILGFVLAIKDLIEVHSLEKIPFSTFLKKVMLSGHVGSAVAFVIGIWVILKVFIIP